MYAGVPYAGSQFAGILHVRRVTAPIRAVLGVGGSGFPQELVDRLGKVKVPRRREHILAMREDEEALLNV